MKRVAFLVSGSGTNMDNLIQQIKAGAIAADPVIVISNKPGVKALDKAAALGVKTEVIDHKAYADRAAFDQALGACLEKHKVDLIVLAGFMRVLTPGFVQHFSGRLVNIHPSLLPSFPGLHTHAQALATGVQVHGCTVHFVTPLLDHGPIIAQGVVSVLSDDRPETLASRLLELEHLVYPRVATWLAEGRVHLTADQRVVVDGVDSRLFFLEQRT